MRKVFGFDLRWKTYFNEKTSSFGDARWVDIEMNTKFKVSLGLFVTNCGNKNSLAVGRIWNSFPLGCYTNCYNSGCTRHLENFKFPPTVKLIWTVIQENVIRGLIFLPLESSRGKCSTLALMRNVGMPEIPSLLVRIHTPHWRFTTFQS